MKCLGLWSSLFCTVAFVTPSWAGQSIARDWDEQILSAIRIDTPHPPVQARNLFSLSVVMYDAWAAYDDLAVGYVYHGKHTAGGVGAGRAGADRYWGLRRAHDASF